MFFLLFVLQNPTNSDKIWYVLSWVNLSYRIVNVFHLTWIVSLHYLVKCSVRVLEENGNEMSLVHHYKFEVFYTLPMHYLFKKSTPILMSIILITTRCENMTFKRFACIITYASHKNRECTPKRVTEFTVTKNEICKPKIQQEKQRFNKAAIHMLSLVANAHSQPWPPLIEDLVDDAMCQFSPDRDEAMHWRPYLFRSASMLE